MESGVHAYNGNKNTLRKYAERRTHFCSSVRSTQFPQAFVHVYASPYMYVFDMWIRIHTLPWSIRILRAAMRCVSEGGRSDAFDTIYKRWDAREGGDDKGREGREAGVRRSMARGRSHKVTFYWQKARRSLGSAGDYTWWSYRSRIDKQWYAKRKGKERERESERKRHTQRIIPQYLLSSPPDHGNSLLFLLSIIVVSPAYLSLSLAIPFGYSATILPAESRGWSCLRLRLLHRCTHSPPTDGPQCTANSHKAPADTQMDKRIWTYTCTRGTLQRTHVLPRHPRRSWCAKRDTPARIALPRLCRPCCRA